MQCSKYKILIHRQLEGRASELETRQLRQHLNTCPSCSRYQEETAALMEALRLTPVPAPPDLQVCAAQRIQAQRRETPSRKPSPQQGFCWEAAVSRPAASSYFSFSWASIFFPFLPVSMSIYRCLSAIFLYPLRLCSAVCLPSGRGFHHSFNLEVSLCNTPIAFCFLSHP